MMTEVVWVDDQTAEYGEYVKPISLTCTAAGGDQSH